MTRLDQHWTCIADEVPGVEGTGLVFAASADADRVAAALETVGYRTVWIDGSAAHSFRDAQRLIAQALRLPDTAGRNLDALADSLGDLAEWPDTPRLALLWRHADVLVAHDLPGWFRLTRVLEDATEELWRGGDPADRLFETVLFMDGFGQGETDGS